MEKVLIIKAGYSEILDKESNSRKVSLGDVLRTTPILHLFKDDKVTWVTDKEAFPLLEGNPFIERLLPYDFTTILQLESEEFDTVVNLEKIPGICALADKIKAWKKYGFRFNTQTGNAEPHEKAFEVLAVSSKPEAKRINERTSNELVFELVGKKWGGEEYVLGYKPSTLEVYDVGFNTLAGSKWPNKAWSMENWNRLEEILKNKGVKVTRQEKQGQEVLVNLNKYIDWVNSSKIIVTNDSLGMHIGIALKKDIIALFGPTPSKEVYFYNKGKAILPEQPLECLPCFNPVCNKKLNPSCIGLISPERVAEEVFKALGLTSS